MAHPEFHDVFGRVVPTSAALVTVVVSFAALLLGVGPSAAAAQDWPVITLDMSVGQSYGRGGPSYYLNRGGTVSDFTLAWRARPVAGGGLLLGIAAGKQIIAGHDAICHAMPDGVGCRPSYPLIRSVGALIGWESGSPGRAAVRLTSGPTAYRAQEGVGDAIGIQARLDAATPAFHHLALVGSVRGDLLPGFQGDTHALGAFMLGIRVR